MNKFVATAVAAAFIAPAAFADVDLGPVKIYGSLRSAVEFVSIDAPTGTAVQDGVDSQTRLADQGSRFGVKGDWKINDNLKAIGQVEARFYLGNNGDPLDGSKIGFGTRNTFVGLESAVAGKALIGRYDNAYKNIRKAAFSAFDSNLNDASELVGDKQVLNRLGGRQGDMFQYETPNWGGFNAQFSYNFGKVTAASKTTTTNPSVTCTGPSTTTLKCTTTAGTTTTGGDKINAPQMSVMAAYNHSMFDIGVGYSRVDDATSDLTAGSISLTSDKTGSQGSESLAAFTVGITGKIAGAKLSAVWEKTQAESNNSVDVKAFDQEQTSYGFGVYYPMGDWEFQAAYAQADNVENMGKEVADTKGSMFDLGVAYKIHKQVKVIASYSSIDNSKNTKFTTGSGFAVPTGADASIIALGLRADF